MLKSYKKIHLLLHQILCETDFDRLCPDHTQTKQLSGLFLLAYRWMTKQDLSNLHHPLVHLKESNQWLFLCRSIDDSRELTTVECTCTLNVVKRTPCQDCVILNIPC